MNDEREHGVLKWQVKGCEVVLAITNEKRDVERWNQIVYEEFADHCPKRVLVNVMEQ